MAITYPRELLRSEVKSPGEEKVFAALRDGLADEWEVFHSASWVARDPAEGALDGEIDFVLCHPERAIVALEVKGGGIECRYGEWFGIHGGVRERIRDPFTQALDHRYALERKLDGGEELAIIHAVALPDVTVHALALAPDAPRDMLLDRTDVREDVAGAVDRALAFHTGARDRRRAPGAEGARRVRELLAPEFRIDVPLAEQFMEEEAALIRLTIEQSLALRRLHRNRRMVVYGCAGSGKTMLAVEHAKRLARDGQDVLFVCFNKALAEHLRATSRDERIDFVHFHRLCARLAHEARIELPSHPKGEAPPEFFQETLPEALVDAFGALGPRYDALIVDEAQDLHDDWLAALRLGLRDERSGPIWLFMDDNQRVYDARLTVPDDFFATELTVNCRNTQAIHREVMTLYRGSVEPEVRGPEGRKVELLHAHDQAATVAGVLERLCGQEEVLPRDVVVLSGHGWENSDVAKALPGRYRLTRERNQPGDVVQFSSIRGFKGLESPAVVLCELDNVVGENQDQLLYTGMSRARNHCVIVAPPAA
jgi:Nuclease-related domain/UvrD-like helicase C-terminal domain/AAA domain